MDCLISAELQRQLVDYIANYTKNHKKSETLIKDMMKELYLAIESTLKKDGNSVTYYHVNAVSMIPFLIENNFMKTSKTHTNKLYNKYNKIFDKHKQEIAQLTSNLEDDNWAENLYGYLDITGETPSSGKEGNRSLDYLRIQAFGSDFFKPNTGGVKSAQGETVVITSDGTMPAIAATVKIDGNDVITLDGVEIDNASLYPVPQIESFEVSKEDIGFFDGKEITDGICQVHFETFDFYANYANKPKNELKEKKDFQFYLNLYKGKYSVGNKVGYISHTTEKKGKRVTEASPIEQKIIDAYLLSRGNLFLRVKNGKYTFFTPKYVYDGGKAQKMQKKEPAPVQRTIPEASSEQLSDASYMTIPMEIRRELHAEGKWSPTNRAAKDLELNDAFVNEYQKAKEKATELTIDGTKVYLKAAIGEPAEGVTFRKKPLILTACDRNGNILHFKKVNNKLTLDDNGGQIVFDMFPGYFDSFNKETEDVKKAAFEKVHNNLKRYTEDDSTAEDIANRIAERFNYMNALYQKVLTSRQPIFLSAESIIVTESSMQMDREKVSGSDLKNLQYNKSQNRFYVIDKDGHETTVRVGYTDEQAQQVEDALFGQMSFEQRKKIIQDTFNNKLIVWLNNQSNKEFTFEVAKGKVINLKYGDKIVASYLSSTNECIVLDKELADTIKKQIHVSTKNSNAVPLTLNFNKIDKKLNTPFGEAFASDLNWYAIRKSKLKDPVFVLKEITVQDNLQGNTQPQTENLQDENSTKQQLEDASKNENPDEWNFKTIVQKALNDPVNEQQIKEAKEWYENSPLSKIVPVNTMFDVVHEIAVAKFKSDGITLMSGSDYTDVYHEAWHSFSQLFLTKQQKTELYETVKKNPGSFTDYSGKKVAFKDADYRQIEEYLAEEFRTYMLTGKTKQKSKIRQFFEKILNILKSIFSDKTSIKPEEYFEKLRIGDISKYTASKENVMFDELQKSIVTKESQSLSMKETYDIKELMNSYMSDFLPLGYLYKDGYLPHADAINYALQQTIESQKNNNYHKGILEEKLLEYAKSKGYDEKKTNEVISSWKQIFGSVGDPVQFNYDDISEFLSSKKRITSAYAYCRFRLMMRQNVLLANLNKQNISNIERIRLQSQLKTIEDALSNYAEKVAKLDDNKYGVVKYHFDKYFGDIELINDDVDTEDEENERFDDYMDNKCNAKSAEQRLGNNKVLKYLLSTIPSYKLEYNSKKDRYEYVEEKNEYNERKLKEFKQIKNRLVVMLQGCATAKEMYQRLHDDAYDGDTVHNPMTAIILKKLGNPDDTVGLTESEIKRKTQLWIQFYQTFSCPEVRLHEILISLGEKTENELDEEGERIYDEETGQPLRKTTPMMTIQNSEMNGPYWKMDDNYRRKFAEVGKTKLSANGFALDVNAILKKYLINDLDQISDEFKRKNLINLIRDCGLDVSLDPKCREQLYEAFFEQGNYSVSNVFDSIIIKLTDNIDSDITDIVSDFWRSFEYNKDNLKEIYSIIKNVDIRFSEDINTEMVKNAEGSTLFMNQQNNSITVLFNNIRTLSNYEDLLNNPLTKHLDIRKYIPLDETHDGLPVFEYNDNYNYNCAGSTIIQKLFCSKALDYKTVHSEAYVKINGKYHKVTNVEEYHPELMIKDEVALSLVNLSGIKVRNTQTGVNKAQSLFQADKDTKKLCDMVLVSNGEMELMRHADNGVSYAVNLVESGENYRWFDASSQIEGNDSWFAQDVEVPDEVVNFIIEGITHEVERYLSLKRLRELAKDPNFAYDREYLDKLENNKLGVFDDMISQDAKAAIYKEIEKLKYYDNVDLSFLLKNDAFRKSLNKYFKKQINDNESEFNNALSIISEGNGELFVKSLYEKYPIPNHLKEIKDVEQEKRIMSAIYTYNNIIYNINCIKLIYGDVMTFNHAKDEFTKRIKGMGSSGKIPCNDMFVNSTLQTMDKTSYFSRVYPDDVNPLIKEVNDGTIKTAICSDLNPISAYANAYNEISDKYETVEEESNAQALITFDAYRMMCVRLDKWDDTKEALFQKICDGEELDPKDIVKFFPVLKLQFNGPLSTDYAPLMAFHKYSLMPLLPNVIKDKNADIVHKKMMQEGISYITFVSGSKEANISRADNERIKTKIDEVSKNGPKPYKNKYGEKLYEPESLDIRKRVSEEDGKIVIKPRELNQDIEGENFFTPNIIPIQYIKDQVEIHDTLDRDTIFATQMRRHIGSNLWDGGYPVDITTESDRKKFDEASDEEKEKMSPIFKKSKRYFDAVKDLTENAQENLKKKFGFNDKDKTLKKRKFYEFIRKELVKKNIPEFALDGITSLEQLQFSPYANEIEKIICSLINRNVIRQHIHGGMYVQVASTLFEDTDGSEFGTNDLQFYGKSDLETMVSLSTYKEYEKDQIKIAKDGETEPGTIKLPLAGDFTKLLKAKHYDGNEIGNIDRLNECLKDKKWVGDNIDALTIVACRIPVQGYNSIENYRIAEFLAPGCNNIVILPSEAVIKSGGDYDIDKLSMCTPHIKLINGEVYLPKKNGIPNPGEDISKDIQARNNIYNQMLNDVPAKLNSIIKHNVGGAENVEKARKYLEQIQNILDEIDKIKEQQDEIEKGFDLSKSDDTYLAELDSALTNEYNRLSEVFKSIISPEGFGTQWIEKEKGVSFAHTAKQYENWLKFCDKVAKDQQNVIKYRMNQSKAGKENEIILAMSDILKDSVVYNSMLKPNQTDLFTGENRPVHDLKKNAQYNRFANTNSETKEGVMSPTRVIEAPYNLDKHDNLHVGKVTLGPTAIDGVFFPVSKYIGLKLSYWTMESKDYYIGDTLAISKEEIEAIKRKPSTKKKKYDAIKKALEKKGITPKDNPECRKLLAQLSSLGTQRIRLRSNIATVDGNPVVDMSKARNLDNEEIAEILSQLLNGCVDVAKEAWTSYINHNRLACATLLFMVQSGVPVRELCYFMSNPAIIEYIRRKTHNESALDVLNDIEFAKAELLIRGKMLQDAGYRCDMKQKYKDRWLPSDLLRMNEEDTIRGLFSRLDPNAFSLKTLMSKVDEKYKDEKDMLQDNSLILAHFFQIEDMAQAPNALKLAIRVDGSKANNLYDILSRQTSITKAENDMRLNQEAVSKVRKSSVMSSFFIEDSVRDIIMTTMPIKADKDLNETFESYFGDEAPFMERDEMFSRWFGDFPSYLHQLKHKVIEEDHSKIVDDILEKAFVVYDNNGNPTSDYYPGMPEISKIEKNALGLELEKRLAKYNGNLKEIAQGKTYQKWIKEYAGMDLSSDMYTEKDKEGFVYRFLLLDSLQAIGDNTQLFMNSEYSIVSKFTLIMNLIKSNKELNRMFTNYIFFNKIRPRSFSNNHVSLSFQSEMDDDQKAVVFEEFNTFRSSEEFKTAFNECNLSDFDKEYILDFFNSLPYFILCQDNMSSSTTSLSCMIDMSVDLKNDYDEFVKMSQKEKDDIMRHYANDFYAKYSSGEFYTFDREDTGEEDIVWDEEVDLDALNELNQPAESYITYNNKTYAVAQDAAGMHHIYNSKGEEVYYADAKDRELIMAKYFVATGEAAEVYHNNKLYYVYKDNTIVSSVSGKLMKWDENNGDRKAILAKRDETVNSSNQINLGGEDSAVNTTEKQVDDNIDSCEL